MSVSKFCNHLFDVTTDGYIQIMRIDNKDIKIYNTPNDGLREIVEIEKGNKDVYISPNTMYKKQRRVENIRQFRALFQDLDIDKIGYSKEETIYLIYILLYEKKIPKPSMIVDSGRGLHIYWKIKNAPFGALHTWQELEDYLYYQLKHLSADKRATDGARILRLPNTLNSKNNSLCNIIEINEDIEYSMYDLREEFLLYKPKQLQLQEDEKKTKKSKVVSNKFFNSYSLHMARIEDIETLCELRRYNLKGYRNMILHCYAYWKGIYIRDIEELEKEVTKLNNSFVEPMKTTEVKAILRCIPKSIDKFIGYEQGIRSGENKRVTKGMRDKSGYWYKNETLIERLDITRDEQRHLKTIIGTDEKYHRNNERRKTLRRNENGLTKKQQELKEIREKILELKELKYRNKEISNQLNIPVKTIERHITAMKKEGILI